MYRWKGAVVAIGLALISGQLAAVEQQTPVGRKVSDFTLKDYRGAAHSLSDFADNKLLVIAFLGTECPLAKLYAPRLAALAAQFGERGVGFVGINANSQDSVTEIASHARTHKLAFPILKDLGNQVADQMGALRTPEVFVLDASRTVRYWGRIDDQYGVGYLRDEPQREDLRRALEELLADKPVSVPVAEAAGCHIGRVRQPKTDGQITFSDPIAGILQRRCVECHREGEIAPFALTDYDEVAGWAETIAEVLRDRRMLPWHADPEIGHFRNDRHMSDEEKQLIYQWVADGAPEGDADKVPPLPTYVTGWQLPRQPDAVFYMRDETVEIPAEGVIRYQYYSIDPGFKEDQWVSAIDVQPGNRSVVHHILVFARTPGNDARGAGGGARGFLGGYVPGRRAEPFPEGMAKRIPAGSQLVFQMHYTPVGSPQKDRSKIGFLLADPDSVKYEVRTTSAVQRVLRIPPHASDHQATATTAWPSGDSLLLSMMPHMHLRGKSFHYAAVRSDGTDEPLLSVPQYDFNWQTVYRLKEPKSLPAGTRIRCRASYDNSEHNLNNPDPTQLVRWGDQTWDEMMIGYFDVAVPVERDAAGKLIPSSSGTRRADARQRIVDRYDANGDGKISRQEVPRALHGLFQRLDRNRDGFVTRDELRKLPR